MKLSTRHLLVGSIVITAIAFLTAGLLGNDQTGFLATLADTAWIVFMVGTLVVLALAVATLVQSVLRRTRQRDAV